MVVSLGIGLASTVATGSPLIGRITGFGGSYSMEGGNAYLEAKDQGVDDKTANKVAVLTGVINATLEMLPMGRLLDKVTNKIPLRQSLTREIVSGLLKQMVAEGGTESLQELATNAVARLYNKQRDLFAGIKEAGFIGALMGAGSSVLIEAPLDIISGQQEIIPAGEHSPQDIIKVIIENKLENTKEGKEVLKIAIEAQRQGNTVNVEAPVQDTTTKKLEPVKEEIETLGKETTVFRGAKDQTIDVTQANGITGGVSFSLDEKTAKNFADKNDGTIASYTISPDAKVVNHSVLEAMPKDQVGQYLKDNEIDVVRFDVPEGSKGEAELRVVNDRVLKVRKEKPFPEVTIEPQDIKRAGEINKIVTKPSEKPTTDKGEEKIDPLIEEAKPTGTGKVKESRLFQRVKEQLGIDFDGKEVTYTELSLDKQAEAVAELLQNDPEKAVRIARGIDPIPEGMTRNAVEIGLATFAMESGDYTTAGNFYTRASLRSTALGQEIVSLRGQMGVDSPLNAVKSVVSARIEQLAKKYKNVISALNIPDSSSPTVKIKEYIKSETKKVKTQLTEQQTRIQNAQSIIDSLIC